MADEPTGTPNGSSGASVPFWRDVRVLAVVVQFVFLGVVLLIGSYLLNNLVTNMETKGFAPHLGWLDLRAGYAISESVISYTPDDTFARALLVGLLNTLLVSVVGIFLATILGLIVGVARLSTNWLVSKLALAYVELFRNTPVLVQLLVIYFVVFLQLPKVKEAVNLPLDMYLSQRGFVMPRPEVAPDGAIWFVFVIVGIVVAGTLWFLAGRRESAGRPTHGLRWFAVLAFLGLPILGWFLIPGGPLAFENPELGAFNLKGGLRFTPEYLALTLTLALFTAAFIAEIIRGGIQAVSKGQLEAARTIGLTEGEVLRLVILPQALRIIIPPLTSQYLNLIKNSSLAFAVGYADVFNVSRTVSELTGQPVAVIIIVMGVYLVISLITSVVMNIYNRAVQIHER
ncbi:MAG: ABC transporter permease subunit [Chloroflexota bacterium]|nr:ABC transporter permease subunit [Chloroflexota bacterium]